jgi:DNA polymerase IV
MRTILHLDMDAFYAAVEQRDHPAYIGKPVIIGSPPDQRGVVSTASYEARKFGVHSAMPSQTAARLCPQGIFLPVRMHHYIHVSEQIREIMEQFTPIIEPLSLDEAFLDVTGVMRQWRDARELARTLKQRIAEKLNLPCSVGIASNKFLAKLASDLEKPNGLCLVPSQPDQIQAFLAPLSVRRIWGVGKVTAGKLAAHQIFTIADIQRRPLSELQQIMGTAAGGEHIWALARGLDERPVETHTEDKSISRERTFAEDCNDPEVLRQVLLELTEQVGHQLRKSKRYTCCVAIKYRLANFRTHTRQEKLDSPISSDRELLRHALGLLEAQKIKEPIRLIGFGISQFSDTMIVPAQQPDLFGETESRAAIKARNERLDSAVDAIRDQYGRNAVQRGNWTLPGR